MPTRIRGAMVGVLAVLVSLGCGGTGEGGPGEGGAFAGDGGISGNGGSPGAGDGSASGGGTSAGGGDGGSGPGTADDQVYLAGRCGTEFEPQACLWKNGELVTLETERSVARRVQVSGSDVLVVGQIGSRAALWRNGVPQELAPDDSPSDATALHVIGDEVYVAGFHGSEAGERAVYWRNGTRTAVVPDVYSRAHAIHVAGGSVFVAGYHGSEPGSAKRIPFYWKDGNRQDLPATATEGLPLTYGSVEAMTVDAGQPVMAGSRITPGFEVPAVWKGKEGTDLDQFRGSAYGVAVVDGTVYAAGTYVEKPGSTPITAALWKNGVREDLPVEVETADREARDVAVQDGAVFVAGECPIAAGEAFTKVACYWRNGERVEVSDERSAALGIWVD